MRHRLERRERESLPRRRHDEDVGGLEEVWRAAARLDDVAACRLQRFALGTVGESVAHRDHGRLAAQLLRERREVARTLLRSGATHPRDDGIFR